MSRRRPRPRRHPGPRRRRPTRAARAAPAERAASGRRRPAEDADEPTGLRIIAGEHRGRRLATPPGRILRPMREQVREALFNILGPGTVEGAAVLDLFAGSGSLGLEALSRGAARACFVERAEPCLDVLARNVALMSLDERARVVRHDLARGVGRLVREGPFDLVLVHPPFELLRRPVEPGEPDVAPLLGQLVRTPGLLGPGATIAFETPRECWPDPAPLEALGLEVELRREYGSTALFVAVPREPLVEGADGG